MFSAPENVADLPCMINVASKWGAEKVLLHQREDVKQTRLSRNVLINDLTID